MIKETPPVQLRPAQHRNEPQHARYRREDLEKIDDALRTKRAVPPEEHDLHELPPKERLARMQHAFLEQLAAPEFLYLQIEEIVPFAEPSRRVGEAATGRTIDGERLTNRQRIASGALGAVEAVLEACHIPTTPTHLVHWLETFNPDRAPLLHAMGAFYAEHAQPRILLQSQVGARIEAGEKPHAVDAPPESEGAHPLPEALTTRIAHLRTLHADEDALQLWERTWTRMTSGAQQDLLSFLDAERALLEQEPVRPS